jgi:hypothetical protein
MSQRGKRSVTALSAPVGDGATALVRRPSPPLDLTPEQSDVWQQVVDALPADWFPRETWPLLSQYCRHTIDARRIGQLIDQECAKPDLDVGGYGELLKMQRQETGALKILAASMRLAQQSARTDGAAATAKKGVCTVKRPWEPN